VEQRKAARVASQREGGISWTNPPGYKGETWNVAFGCSPVSAGCVNCWARGMVQRIEASREAAHYAVNPTVTTTGKWNGHVELLPDWLSRPLHWREPRCVAVQLLGDLFHEQVPFEFVAAVYGVIAATHRHRYILLTKRPERRLAFHRSVKIATNPLMGCEIQASRHVRFKPRKVEESVGWPLPNLIEGISVEDQNTLEQRWPVLRDTPAAARCISAEPLLGPLDFSGDIGAGIAPDWVIVGGDNHISRARARPCNVQWIRDVVRQCRDAKVPVPVHVKQLGSKPITQPNGRDPNARPYPITDRAGRIVSEWPTNLQDAREWPEVPRG
jgi:protein gp37